MNNNLYISRVSILALILFVFSSCKKDEPEIKGKGQIKFCFTVTADNSLKSTNVTQEASSVIFSIDKADGTNLITSQKVPLQKFGTLYITEPMALEEGNYKLTYFAVADASDKIIYLSPVSGSPLASLVQHPLSIDFTIIKNQVCTLIPEVLSTENTTPGDFGFYDFKFLIYKPIEIYVYSYNASISNYELTTASLTVSNGTTNILTSSLTAQGNIISIPLNEDNYILTMQKSGFVNYTVTYTKAELEAISKPLVIKLEPDLTIGLVAYYPLNGNANDVSGNGNNGTVNGATLTTDRLSQANSAYSFNGVNSYISLPSTNLKNSQYTVSLWVLAPALPAAGTSSLIFDIGSPSGDQLIDLANNYVGTEVFNGWSGGGYNISESQYATNSNETPTLNQWYFITVTRSLKSMSLYVNGVLKDVATNATESQPSFGTGTVLAFIGKRYNDSGFFNGKVDDVRIYNRVLNSYEVQLLYNK